MITMLQQAGYSALQAASPASKLEFTSFRLGDLENVTPGTAYTDAQGGIVYTGTVADISYVPFSDGRFTLQLLIDASKPLMNISNIMLFVEGNVPFCLCFGKLGFMKTSTTVDGTGMRYMFQLELRFPNIFDKISVDNISENVIEFYRVADEATLDAQFMPLNGRDQGFLEQHAALNRGVPLLWVNGKLWGNPLMKASDDPKDFRFDGGVVGDGYLYTYGSVPETTWIFDTPSWTDDNYWLDTRTFYDPDNTPNYWFDTNTWIDGDTWTD